MFSLLFISIELPVVVFEFSVCYSSRQSNVTFQAAFFISDKRCVCALAQMRWDFIFKYSAR